MTRFASQDKPCKIQILVSKVVHEQASQSVSGCHSVNQSVCLNVSQAAKHYPPFHTYVSQVASRFCEYKTPISLLKHACYVDLLFLLM